MKILSILIVFLGTILCTQTAFAQSNYQSSNQVILTKDQTIEGDYFATGNNVTIAGTVNGDVYITGGNVLIEGTVNGDLLATGGNINVSGNIVNNIRVAGGQVVVSGQVGKNMTLLAGNATIVSSTQIGGSLVAATGMLNLQAPINKSINIASEDAILSNTINGNVNAAVGNLTITPNANINGNINYWSSKQANVQPGSSISGQIKQNIPEKPKTDGSKFMAFLAGLSLIFSIIMTLTYLLGGLFLISFYPIYSSNLIQTFTNKPLLSFLVGLIFIIFFPVILFALFITVIGIPLALLLTAIFCIIAFFGPIVASLIIGQKILERTSKNRATLGWSLILGLIIYAIMSLIPILGGLFLGIVTTIGIGTLLLQQKSLYQKLRSQKII